MTDVSCRGFDFFAAAGREGIVDLDALLSGCDVPRAHLEDRSKRVPWEVWAALCDRYVELVGQDAVLEGGDLLVRSRLSLPLVAVARGLVKPAQLYRLVPYVGSALYRPLVFEINEVDDRRLRMRISVPEGRRGSIGWSVIARSVMDVLPQVVNQPASRVTTEELTDRCMQCLIEPAQRPTFLTRVRAGWARLRSGSALVAEFESHHRQLTDTYEALRHAERGFREALDSLPEGVCIHLDDEVVYANPPLAGWLQGTSAGLDLQRACAPEQREALRAVVRGERSGPLELIIEGVEPRWLEVTGVDLRFEGSLARMLFCVDITSRHLAEAEAEAGRETLTVLKEAIPDLVLRLDADDRIVDVLVGTDHPNVARLEALRGLTPATYAAQAFSKLERDAGVVVVKAVAEARAAGEVTSARVVVGADDQPRWVEVRCIPSGSQILLLVRDITGQRRLEEQLAVSERMAAVGTLAAGVAHEINNPLTYISANLEVLLADLDDIAAGKAPDVETMREALTDAVEGADRVARIVHELKGLSRPGPVAAARVDLDEVVTSALRLASYELRDRPRVTHDRAGAPAAWADPHAAGQLLVNLVVNACQPMGSGLGPAKEVVVRTDAAPDGRPRVSVRGVPGSPGIAGGTAGASSGPALGSGLELAVADRIAESLGAELQRSDTDEACFVVVFPAAAVHDRVVPEPPSVPPRADPQRRRSILLVDDDEPVGRMIARMLAEHEVTVVTHGLDALEHMQGHVPDLVLCDLMMPEMSGIELYGRLRERNLHTRVVFVSGGAFTPEATEFLAGNDVELIQKPFRAAALRERVAELLEREVSAAG